MRRIHAVLLCFSLLSCAVPAARGEQDSSTVPASQWLDALDQRFVGFDRPLTLARWQRSIGEEPLDTAEAEAARAAFYADTALRSRLVELGADKDAELAARARAWLVFIDRERLEADPEVLAISARLLRAMEGEEGSTSASALVGGLIFDPDPAVQHQSLAEIEVRSRAVLPLFRERARRLDALAREMGAPDVATFLGGPRALADLEATCRAQLERTQADWEVLQRQLASRLGHKPELGDFIGATLDWTMETGAFFTGDNVGPLAAAAVKRMGFDLDSMHIEIRVNPEGVGGSAFGVSIPDDVRFQGNFAAYPRGYFHELGHAVHMKRVRAPHLPARLLPQDRALNEGVGEIFALIARDPAWLAEVFPTLTARQLEDFQTSVRCYDAMAVRFNALQARLEQELYAGHDIAERWPVLFEELLGAKPTIGPTWILFAPSYLETPFYLRAYVFQMEVRDTFLRRLGGRSLVSPEGGRLLDETLLGPGNALTLAGYLEEHGR